MDPGAARLALAPGYSLAAPSALSASGTHELPTLGQTHGRVRAQAAGLGARGGSGARDAGCGCECAFVEFGDRALIVCETKIECLQRGAYCRDVFRTDSSRRGAAEARLLFERTHARLDHIQA